MTDAHEDTTWSVERPLVTEDLNTCSPTPRGAGGHLAPPSSPVGVGARWWIRDQWSWKHLECPPFRCLPALRSETWCTYVLGFVDASVMRTKSRRSAALQARIYHS